MLKTFGIAAAFILLASAVFAGINTHNSATAWKVGHSASAICNDDASISFNWSFENQEPNKESLSMDLIVSDSNSNATSETYTVKPGETVTGILETDLKSVENGTISFTLTWSDGRTGIDTRTSHYTALQCAQPPIETEVCRDGVVITIREDERLETDLNAPCPTPKEVQVCRDGVVVNIAEHERLESDTEAPCPTPTDKSKIVCRAGKTIEIDPTDAQDGDLAGECPEVEGAQTLPVTGINEAISFVLGIATVGAGAYGYGRHRS